MIRAAIVACIFALANLAGGFALAQQPVQWNYSFDGNGNAWARYPGGLTVGSPAGGSQGVGTINATGLFVNGAAVGGGGSPGGSNGQLQYNNAGAFGGFTLGGDCTLSQPNITCSKIGGNSNVAFLNVAQSFAAPQRAAQQTIAIAGTTFTPNFNTGQDFVINLAAACPCTLANPSTTPVAGQKGVIYVIQPGTGNETLSFSGSQYLASGGVSSIVLSANANAIDVFSYVVKSATEIVVSQGGVNVTH